MGLLGLVAKKITKEAAKEAAKKVAKKVATEVVVQSAITVASEVVQNKMRRAIGADEGELLQENAEDIGNAGGTANIVSSTDDEGVTDSDEVSAEAVEEDMDPSLYEKIEVSGIVSVQDSMEYYQKNIALSATFSVSGKLTFKNCTIAIAPTASFNVAGLLKFQNCEIISDPTRAEHNYVITSSDNSKIIFSNCTVENGVHFVNGKGGIEIRNCTLSNCATFIVMDGEYKANFSIKSSVIRVSELATMGHIFEISRCEKFVASELTALWSLPDLQQGKYSLFEVEAEKATVTNCEIKNAKISVFGCDTYIDKCSLYDCECSATKFSNCKVYNSDIGFDGAVIDKCDFENMHNKSIWAETISNSTFDNLHNKDRNFISLTGGLDNCVFSNVNMEAGSYLIYVKLDYGLGDKKKDIVVSNCRFLNCYTERADKKLIVGKQVHHTLFTDKEKPYDVRCLNCMGLNGVKNGKFVEEPV